MNILHTIKFISLVAILSGSVAIAQQSDVAALREASSANPLGVRPSFSPSSLLDGSRISWSNSYSVSFFSSGSGSGSAGLLNSTMFYKISPSLRMAFNLGVLHSGSLFGGNTAQRTASFLPGFALDYRPSENFRLSLLVQRVNGYGTPGYYQQGYSNRWSPWSLR